MAAVAVVAGGTWLAGRGPGDLPPAVAEAQIQPLTVHAVYEGTIEARQTATVVSKCTGGAVLVEVVPEGTAVRTGDVVARFGSALIEQEMLKTGRDAVAARVALETLRDARLPLELRALETELADRQADLAAEQQALADTLELIREDLVPREEAEKQRIRVRRFEGQVAELEQKRALTLRHIHPALLREAEANLLAAEQAQARAEQQVSNCVVRATAEGIVVYTPLHLGTEFRVVRVGDTVYENQPFLLIPDTRRLICECLVPEAELSRVQQGRPVQLQPVSFPDLWVKGEVEWVSTMAQQAPGQPFWQRFFRIRIGLADADERLRPGLTARAHVIAYENPAALVVPRRAVEWRDGSAYCRRMDDRGQVERRPVRVGAASATAMEVLDGLKPGDRVVLE